MADFENKEDESGGEEEEVEDLSNSDVTTKYQEAAKIANLALQGVMQACMPGAIVKDLCKFGDEVIEQRCQSIFRAKVKGEKVTKGVAFPTCVSVNECVCHNCPLELEAGLQQPLAEGDLVKIDLGCHIGGYMAVVAHTLKVGHDPTPEKPISGVEADVFLAAYQAAEVAAKMIKPGNTNVQVTAGMKKVADAYGVNLMQGTLMHQKKRYIIDGRKVIMLREDPDNKVEDCTFEENEVYAVDVAVSSGEGKPREAGTRTTVFKRVVNKTYQLKMKASRYLLKEVNSRFPTLPFCLRSMEDEKSARMGVVECLNHELVIPYPVLFERQGDKVAHFKFTVLLLPSGTSKVTGMQCNVAGFSTDKTLDEETRAVLASSSKKKKKKKKKAAAAADAAAAEGGAEAAAGADP